MTPAAAARSRRASRMSAQTTPGRRWGTARGCMAGHSAASMAHCAQHVQSMWQVRSTDCTAAGLASGAGAAEGDLGGGRRGPIAAKGRSSRSRCGAVAATGGWREGAEWRRGVASPAARILGDAAGLAIHRQHASGELDPAIQKVALCEHRARFHSQYKGTCR